MTVTPGLPAGRASTSTATGPLATSSNGTEPMVDPTGRLTMNGNPGRSLGWPNPGSGSGRPREGFTIRTVTAVRPGSTTANVEALMAGA